MTAVQLRNQLIQLIQREGDVKLLELLGKLLGPQLRRRCLPGDARRGSRSL